MTQQTINIGTVANDGTGDALRASFGKVNNNFTELYEAVADKADASAVTSALAGKIDASAIDTDSAMAANSDDKLASQKATKAALAVKADKTAVRELLTADRTYYVRTDGSDSNDGRTDASGGAFKTLQKAINIATALDMSIYKTTIQIGDGTYTAGAALTTSPTGPIVINGNSSTPANVVVQAASVVAAQCNCDVTVQNFEAQGSSTCINSLAPGAKIKIGTGMRLTGAGVAISASNQGFVYAGAVTVTLSGNKTAWMLAGGNSVIQCEGTTFSLSGTPAWSSYGIGFNTGAAITLASCTISGSATGLRYYGTSNAVLNTGGAGSASTYFPGNSDGSTGSGAQQI